MPKTTKHLKQHQFKKGNNANPLGGRAHNPIAKALKKIGRVEFQEIIELALKGDVELLQQYAQNTKLSVIQMGVVRALVKAALKGDWSVFKDIVEQLVGKNPDVVHVTSTNETALTVITDEELKARRAKIIGDV